MKTGDVVKLKSGGPAMTIDGGREDFQLVCVWFDGEGFHRQIFNATSLEPAPKIA